MDHFFLYSYKKCIEKQIQNKLLINFLTNYVFERDFSCMNREKPVLGTRLGEDTLDNIMRIKIIGASLDNFNTEKFVSDWIESTVTSSHLYGHNSSRTETHEEADENIIVL